MCEDLVELGFMEDAESWRLESYLFPSKIGGKPAWLDLKYLPTPEDLQCKICKNPMIFLCQLYAPLEENMDISPNQLENNFHRTLFVFICRNSKCCSRNNSSNIKVLRSTLKRNNEFYSFDPPSEDHPTLDFSLNKWTTVCEVCGCYAEKKCSSCKSVLYCSRQHQVFDWKEKHKNECCLVKNNHKKSNILFNEGEIVIEAEEINDVDNTDFERYKMMVDNSKNGTMSNISQEEFEAYAAQETDKVFQKFQKRIKHNSEQIIRYKRGGKPLWIAKYPLPEKIPNCEYCNSPRQFEFQIMPQMLSVLTENDLDWGIITVYTCVLSCSEDSTYKTEFSFKQDVELNDVCNSCE